MDGMKVIHLEDSVDKHMKVCRELQKIGVISVEWATSVSEGLEKIEAARQEGAAEISVRRDEEKKKRNERNRQKRRERKRKKEA